MIAPRNPQAAQAASKKKNKKKLFTRIKDFFQAVWAELKNVHWPTKVQLIQYTGIVLGVCVVLAFGLWIVDSLLSFLLDLVM